MNDKFKTLSLLIIVLLSLVINNSGNMSYGFKNVFNSLSIATFLLVGLIHLFGRRKRKLN